MSEETTGAGSLLEEFFVRLGVKADHKALHSFKESLGGVKHAMEALGVFAAFELGKRLMEFIERSVGAAAQVQETAEVIDMSATQIAAFNSAALDGGVAAQEMQGALEGVTRAAGAAAAGFPRYQKLFEQLFGKDGAKEAKKSTEEIFTDLAKKFETMDSGTRMAVAGRLGIAPKLAKLMSEGGGKEFAEAVEKYRKGAILTDADYERAHATEITFAKLAKTIQQVSTLIAIELAPAVQRIVDAFQAWWAVSRQDVLTKVGDWIWIVIYYIGMLYDWVGKVTRVISILWDSLTFGLLPGFKGVVAAVLALEGIKLAVWIQGVAAALRGLAPMLGTVALVLVGIMGLVSIGTQLKDNWGAILLWMRDMWRGIWENVKGVADAILRIPGVRKAVDWVAGQISTDYRGAATDYTRTREKEAQAQAQQRLIPDAYTADGQGIWHIMKNASAAGSVTSTTSVEIGTVNISADKGREATVGEQLQSQIRKASTTRNAQGPFKS